MNVGEAGSSDSGLVSAAREFLVQAGARLDSGEEALQALQAILRRLHGHLEARLGDGGFRTIVVLAHRGSLPGHPILERFLVATKGTPILESVEAPPPHAADSTLGSGLVDLLARTLGLLREVAQDQDWELEELWPVLKKLEEAGVPLRSSESGDLEFRTSRGK